MNCPKCGAMIPIGPLATLAAVCRNCGFGSSPLSLEDGAEALKKGAAVRRAAEKTLKRKPRR